MQNVYRTLLVLVGLIVTLTSCKDLLGSPNEGPGPNHDLDLEWLEYIKQYNKTYGGAEAKYRRYIWEDNLATIFRHNEELALGKQTYTMGVNEFTDWTFEEFSSRYLSAPRPVMASGHNITDPLDVITEYDEMDWRTKGAVTPVKNQGQCGSCWAFSTTGAIEGQSAIKRKTLVSLSEQMLVDCCKQFGEAGCNGGFMDKAFECVKSMGGIDSEKSYPYEAKDGRCRFSRSGVVAKVTGYRSSQGQSSLHRVVQEVGPASVSMHATKNLMHYTSGVFTDNTCNKGQVNHGVLAVGYGNDYWLIKNSWGTSWGMQGYFKIKRGASGPGMCMIATEVSVPTM